jgi:L-arabinose isomerase
MTNIPAPLPEVWFLTGSQGLYGPETLDQVASQSRGIADRLDDGSLPVRVVWKPVLLDAVSIHRQILEANSAPECVGVIA